MNMETTLPLEARVFVKVTPRWANLLEAALLSAAGGIVGVLAGMGIGPPSGGQSPAVSVHVTPAFVAAALGVSLVVGLAGGALPARRAARLDPLEALRAE